MATSSDTPPEERFNCVEGNSSLFLSIAEMG